MAIALRLAARQWAARPLRPLLCSLAIAAAVALIICVGAAFDSLVYSLQSSIGQMLGIAEIHVRPTQRGTAARIPQNVVDQLRSRPEIELVAGRIRNFSALTKGDEHRWFDTFGIDQKLDEKLRPKAFAAGGPLTGKDDEILIDTTVSDVMKLKVGDTAEFSIDGMAKRPVRVVGIFQRPAIELLSKPTVFLPMEKFAADLGVPLEFNVVDLKLRDVDDLDVYVKKLQKDLGPGVHVDEATGSKARLGNETKTIQMGLSMLSIVSGICAALIIGTTLSVGVQERVRQFGQFRCIGASRVQLALFLAADALLLMVVGQIIGLALGVAISAAVVKMLPQFFVAYKLSGSSIAIALLNGCLATFFGSLIPMWQVTRVTPMAAVTNTAQRARPSRVRLAAFIGFGLLIVQPILWYGIPAREVRFFTYTIIGIPMIFLGYTLMGPMVLLLLERFGAVVIGRAMQVKPTLLRSAWSRTPWRAGAMIAALMIGVTLLVAVRGRGESILKSWVFPTRFPDVFMYSVAAITPERVKSIKSEHPEVAEATVLAAFPVKMSNSVFSVGEVMSRSGTTFVAVDPDAFSTMLELDFVQGDPKTAVAQLASGGHVFVAREFQVARGLGVGDKLTFNGADGKPVEFTIAAVVTSNGVDMVKSYFDLRSSMVDQSVSSVLGTIDDAKKHFKLRDVNIMLLNVKEESKQREAMKGFRDAMAAEGFQTASSVEMKTGLRDLILQVVDTMSLIAIGGLAVASLGVANMVIASVHARRYEFGVLRAIGAGRWQLIRLVLAEVTLIGCVAGALGALAGVHFTFMGAQVDRTLVGFPTVFLDTTLWGQVWAIGRFILIGAGVTTLLAWLASIVPAVRGAYAAQRTLLAGGRA